MKVKLGSCCNDGFDPVRISVAGGVGFDKPRSSPKCRRVFYAESFKATRVENIKDFFFDMGVVEVRKLHSYYPFSFTFDGSTLSNKIRIEYCFYSVWNYYLKPFQCFHCYNFRHGKG